MNKISTLISRLLQYCVQTAPPNATWAIGVYCICLSWSAGKLQAEDFLLPPNDVDLIGQVRIVKARKEDTLLDVARRYDLGLDAMVAANPNVDQWIPAKGNPDITLPTRYILPDAPREGIVINSPEKRLYYFPPATDDKPRHVVTHPVSVGRVDWRTPIGITKILSKQEDPVWRPPASIRAEAITNGKILPEVVPAGPDNPLGKYAMRLAFSGSYLIHGTDKAFGIGMQVTHGCMRLYPEDIETLFKQVPIGTKVNLVNQPIKLGWFANTLFVEITPPLEEDTNTRDNMLQLTLDRIEAERTHHPSFRVDGAALKRAITEQTGIPVAISQFEDF
jgi:L,D-transpeptidase ErfK/SrfK